MQAETPPPPGTFWFNPTKHFCKKKISHYFCILFSLAVELIVSFSLIERLLSVPLLLGEAEGRHRSTCFIIPVFINKENAGEREGVHLLLSPPSCFFSLYLFSFGKKI